MSARDFAARVESLAEGPCAHADSAGAPALGDDGQELLNSVQQLRQIVDSEQDRQQLRQVLVKIATLISKLGDRLQDGMLPLATSQSTPADERSDRLAYLLWQAAEGCGLAASCSTSSKLAGASAEEWQPIAASIYSLLHGVGHRLLQLSTARLTAVAAVGPDTEAAAHMLLAQLQAAAAVADGMPLEQQLQAGLLQPAGLRAWLGATLRLLCLLRKLGQPGWVQQPVLPILPQLACTLYNCIELEPHWVLDHNGSNEEQLVQLLMQALPALAVSLRLPAERRPPDCSWETAASMLKTLNLPGIALASDAWHSSTDSRRLLGALSGAAQLLAMLDIEQPLAPASAADPLGSSAGGSAAGGTAGSGPTSGSAGAAPGSASGPGSPAATPSYVVAMDAVMTVTWPVYQFLQRIDQQATRERQRVARDLLPVVARLPSLAALVSNCWPAHAQRMEARGAQGTLVSTCTAVVSLLIEYARRASSPLMANCLGDAASWCTAASAALRSIPLLVQFEQPAGALINVILNLAKWASVPASILTARHAAGIASEAAAAAAQGAGMLKDAVWELHTRSCRLVHFLNAGSCGVLLHPTDHHYAMESSLGTLSACMEAASLLFERPPSSPSDPTQHATNRQLEAMAVSHLSALSTVFGTISLSMLDDKYWRICVGGGLSAMTARGPEAIQGLPALHTLLEQFLEAPSLAPEDCVVVFRNCAAAPLAMAHLILSGHIQAAVLRALASCTEAGVAELLADSSACVSGVLEAALNLRLEDKRLAEQISNLIDSLDMIQQHSGKSALRMLVHDILPQTVQAAAAVVEHLTPLPEAAQLELAQAAAARSCAYLRCANLGGEGGPAAGQGTGSLRCSACRAVWYCGTTCSHADWRAGHRRVCKALGAARAAEKERRRQQAAGEGEGLA